MKKAIAFLGILCVMSSVGCGSKTEIDVKLEGRSQLYVLPKGMKVVNITDKSYNMKGVMIRPMRPGEKAEIYTWISLPDGVGALTIKETE